MESRQIKVLFVLEQNDGYPPVGTEGLWATKTPDGFYELDNIPFYAQEVSYKDVVQAAPDADGAFYFEKVVRRSGHSTVRVIVFDLKERDDLQRNLEALGCSWEGGHEPSLIAVDIPREVGISSVLRFLRDGFDQDRWDYEEACIPKSKTESKTGTDHE